MFVALEQAKQTTRFQVSTSK